MAFQGIPGVPEGYRGLLPTRTFDPLLLPRWFQAVVTANGQVGYQSPEAFLAANARADATSGAMTITGSPGAADTLAVTITNAVLPGGFQTLTYTVSGTPTVTVVAAGVAAMINNDPTCRAFGINASSLAGVVTLTHNGPIGNFSVLSAVATQVGGTIAVAVASSGAFTGGSGPVVPLAAFNVPFGSNLFQFYYGRPTTVGSTALAAFNAAGCPLA